MVNHFLDSCSTKPYSFMDSHPESESKLCHTLNACKKIQPNRYLETVISKKNSTCLPDVYVLNRPESRVYLHA
jgi:hypothetical protein